MGRFSGFGTTACPLCGAGNLRSGSGFSRCAACGRRVEAGMLRTLQRIAALPDAVGSHACDCGHPEMRRLPDGVFHCPACGSEVTSHVTAWDSKARITGGGKTKRAA
jgi:ribosomal protein L37AE/L43A